MRSQIFLAFFLAAAAPLLGQVPGSAASGLPQDTAGVFASFSPSYDYSTFKPWHLKATYQLSDGQGKPAGQGTYEYWWASPQLYRSSWTRADATYTEWHMADGKVAYQGSSAPLSYFEYKLKTALVSPLTAVGELDPASFRLDQHGVSASHSVVTCFHTVPIAPQSDPGQAPAMGLFPSYCFNTQKQFLLGAYSFGTLVAQYNAFTPFQGKPVAREFYFREGTRFFLSAKIEEIGELSPSAAAAALTPPQTARPAAIDKVKIGADAVQALLVSEVAPVDPRDAKDAHIGGKVLLRATIGIDGRVRDLELLSAPDPSLAFSAFRAVSQWQYKPYQLNGHPVEVETTVTVSFAPGK
jgi:TonB family protein